MASNEKKKPDVPQTTPTGTAPGAGIPAPGGATPPPIQRWRAGRKREVVLRLLRGEPLDAVSRETGVEIYRLEEWRDRALAGMDAGLRERESDRGQDELDAAMKQIGELTMMNELLRMRVEKSGPLAPRRSKP